MDLKDALKEDIKREIDSVLAVIREDDFEFALVNNKGELEKLSGLTSDIIVTILIHFMSEE